MGRARIDVQAWRDVVAIARYLGEVRRNPSAARKLIDEFECKAAVYARQPKMGDLRNDLEDDLRSFTFRRWYVAVYRPLADGIDVLRVFDGRRDYAKFFFE
ncbi:MAG: type II toxin-antitoxin system RelE/ParE family toxin [Planctomycetaceae bacterium]